MRYLKFLLCIALFGAFGQVNGQIYINSYRFGGAQLLLDEFPNAAGAYSLRKLREAYTGNCIVVRRASNSDTTTIGFVDNYLDTATLKTFCSGTSCFVRRWFDQSGNNRTMSMTTDANQPRIVNNGTVDRITGEVTLFFDGTDDNLGSAAAILSNDNFSIFGVVNASAQTNKAILSQHAGLPDLGRTAFLGTGESNTSKLRIFFNNGTSYGGESTTDAFNDLDKLIYSESNDAGTTKLAVNGSIETVITGQTWTPLNEITRIGGFGPSNTPTSVFTGNIKEIIIYSTLQTSRTNIDTNINTFYSIY